MNYEDIKQIIESNIKDNDKGEITAEVLRDVLMNVVDVLSDGYIFGGVVTPSDTPRYSDAKMFYIAREPGIYDNFGSIEINELSVLLYDEAFNVESLGVPFNIQEDVSLLLQEVGKHAESINILEMALLSNQEEVKDLGNDLALLNNKYNKLGYTYISTATPLTTPITLTGDEKVFYIATEEGDYTNYGLGTISELSVIKSLSGSWIVEGLGVPFKISKEHVDDLILSAVVNAGYKVVIPSKGSYSTITSSFITPITSGTWIKNNGTSLILGDSSALNSRKDIATDELWQADFDIAFIRTLAAGDVDIDVGVKISENSGISWDDIPENVIKPENTTFFEIEKRKNLFNIEKAEQDVILKSSGNNVSQNGWVTSEYIPFTESMGSVIGSIDGNSYSESSFTWAYNADKQPTHRVKNTESTMLEWKSGDAYVRYSFRRIYADKAQIEVGSVITPYEPYTESTSTKIKEEYLPEKKEEKELKYFFLPKHIYVASGRTIELYYEQMLLNSHLYNIQAQCPIGSALERKFQIIGDADHIGDYTLTVNIYDNNGNKLKEATSTIHVVGSDIANDIKLLPIGDSLTNNKAWLDELKVLSSSKITTVGTRGSIARPHEGRSGGSVNTYMNVSGDSVYSFDHNYIGVGSDSDIFSTAQTYSIGDYCKYEDSVYVFIAEHLAGTWDANHVYNITEGNPFYDWETKAWSFTKYKQRNNINPDVIMIYLGTNGINLEPETNNKGALGIKNLIDKIRLEDADTPIIVVNTIFRSGQNGIGKQGNTDGYSAQSEYKFNADRKVLLLAKALDEMVGDYPNVYLCPVGFTHDSRYNFGNVKKAVNPRLEVTEDIYELYPHESIHPQNAGYMQMADEMFSTVCSIFN